MRNVLQIIKSQKNQCVWSASPMHKLMEYTSMQWTPFSFDQAEQLPKQAVKSFQKRHWN